jgi:hypothetical protein
MAEKVLEREANIIMGKGRKGKEREGKAVGIICSTKFYYNMRNIVIIVPTFLP